MWQRREVSRRYNSLIVARTRLKLFEQAFQIFKFERGAGVFTETAAEFLEDFAGALHVDLIGHLDASTGIGTVGGAGGAAEWVERCARAALVAAAALSHLLIALAHHLLSHGARALAQLVKRPTFRFSGAVEIAVSQCFLSVLHGLAGLAKLARRIDALPPHAVLQPTEHVTQRLLAVT